MPVQPPQEHPHGWGSIVSLKESPRPDLDKIQNWINGRRPDEIGHIHAVFSQDGGPGSDYNITVFCKKGAGKLGAVTVGLHPYQGPQDFVVNHITGRSLVVIGFYNAVGQDSVFTVMKN
ncbi:hypothetical protein KQ910_07875 [Reyranella sp. MMS21-HV4-11]|uniref:Uncharacterized protein n=1 Tax=Reyranella humidisoli TaxID=2849149 RepID=A0ABS6IK85_9HYPH|nr:hypothetical protein [Reyranella sp. MMS21-HV4-11]MBU8873678.1 hypothetical protein [Reyranella sp. MMS21-HV4-11]